MTSVTVFLKVVVNLRLLVICISELIFEYILTDCPVFWDHLSAVEPIRRKQNANALRNHGGRGIKEEFLLGKADAALRPLDLSCYRNGSLANPQADHQAFEAISDLALIHRQNDCLSAGGRHAQNLRNKTRHDGQGVDQRVLQPAIYVVIARIRILRLGPFRFKLTHTQNF